MGQDANITVERLRRPLALHEQHIEKGPQRRDLDKRIIGTHTLQIQSKRKPSSAQTGHGLAIAPGETRLGSLQPPLPGPYTHPVSAHETGLGGEKKELQLSRLLRRGSGWLTSLTGCFSPPRVPACLLIRAPPPFLFSALDLCDELCGRVNSSPMLPAGRNAGSPGVAR
jgi:hypothetical protein